jgi:hypothetical protein
VILLEPTFLCAKSVASTEFSEALQPWAELEISPVFNLYYSYLSCLVISLRAAEWRGDTEATDPCHVNLAEPGYGRGSQKWGSFSRTQDKMPFRSSYPPSTVKQPRYHLPVFEGFAQCISRPVPVVGQVVGEGGSESAGRGAASLREDFR